MPAALRQPHVILPVVGQVPDNRSGFGRHFTVERKGIRFFEPAAAVSGFDAVFVWHAAPHAGGEALPDPRIPSRFQLVPIGVPIVKIADHGNLLGIRRPHAEMGPGTPVGGGDMGAEFVVESKMVAFVEQINVVFAQQRNALLDMCPSCRQFSMPSITWWMPEIGICTQSGLLFSS